MGGVSKTEELYLGVWERNLNLNLTVLLCFIFVLLIVNQTLSELA